MEQFANSDFLSDCQLKYQETLWPAHKIILASGSKYFLKTLQENKDLNVLEIQIPVEPSNIPYYNENKVLLEPQHQPSFEELVPVVLRFIYSNSDEKSIQYEFNPFNAIWIYSLAQSIGNMKLKSIAGQFLIEPYNYKLVESQRQTPKQIQSPNTQTKEPIIEKIEKAKPLITIYNAVN